MGNKIDRIDVLQQRNEQNKHINQSMKQRDQMSKHGSSAITPSDTTFISITLIRALAIAGIIVENYCNVLGKNDAGTFSDLFTSYFSAVAGTFVHMFFVLSGYGLTLSCLKKKTVSWTAWTRERFRKIVIPYWAAVIVTFAAANLSYHWAPVSWDASYSWVTLLAYLSFLRNFYQPGWTLNPSFWFMPAIIGLYVLFPFLLAVLKRSGMTGLIVLSILVSNVSIAVCVYFGYPVFHQSALPFFFVAEFAIGMVLACFTYNRPLLFRQLMEFRYFLLGIAIYGVSIAIVYCQILGNGSSTYNDIFEAVGLYLVLLYVCRLMSQTSPPGVLNMLASMSRNSYMMYLIHWPILSWVLKPVIGTWYRTGMDAIPMLLSSFVFVLLIYMLATVISNLIKKITPVSVRTLPAKPD